MKSDKKLLCVLFFIVFPFLLMAQIEKEERAHANQFTLLSGMIQPVLLRGINVAGTYFSNHIIYEYSHGMFLNYPRFLRKDDHASLVYSPWSTGPGIGYRINSKFDIRAEAKAHRYVINLPNDNQANYTAYSLGVGFYSRRYFGSHYLMETSIRYWPTISSTLSGDTFRYVDEKGNTMEHKAHSLGFIFNISLGYTFSNKKNQI